jgi:hypothetical protein
VKRKVVSGVLTGIALLTLSAGVAQAGAGGTPFALTSFFVCDSVTKGLDATQIVDIEGPHIGPPRSGVRISSGALACAVAKLFPAGPRINCTMPDPTNPVGTCPAGTGTVCSIPQFQTQGVCEIAPNPSNLDPANGATFENLKCYSVTVSPRNSGSPPPGVIVTDQLVGTETVQDSGIQFVCAPSGFRNP